MANYGTHTYNTTIEVAFDGRDAHGEWIEWEVSVELECVYPGDPGCTYGPPENCYPPEGPDFEWLTFEVFVGKQTILKTKLQEPIDIVLGETVRKCLIDAAFEDAQENWTGERNDY